MEGRRCLQAATCMAVLVRGVLGYESAANVQRPTPDCASAPVLDDALGGMTALPAL